jgi:hypothetical protein
MAAFNRERHRLEQSRRNSSCRVPESLEPRLLDLQPPDRFQHAGHLLEGLCRNYLLSCLRATSVSERFSEGSWIVLLTALQIGAASQLLLVK